VENWIGGCGYGGRPARPPGPAQTCQTGEDDLTKPGRLTCADPKGTVRKEKPAGRKKWKPAPAVEGDDDLDNVTARLPARVRPAHDYLGPRRWPGYGARPAGLQEQTPESLRLAGDDDPEVYHAERIVGKRTRRGRVEYLVRWRGYTDEDDTWEPRENLMAGADRMISDYERRRARA